MQCESAREIKIEMRTNETCLICNLRQMSNRGKKQNKTKLDNSPSFGEGSESMRYSATWLSVCWAATMCCPSWLVWICWAGPDGLLKALPYGIPEKSSQPIPPHSDFKLFLLLLWSSLSLLLFMHIVFTVKESYHCATQKQNVWLI